MRLLVITQKVDKSDPILGFFHGWLAVFSEKTEELTVICLEEGEHSLPDGTSVLSLGKERQESRWQYLKRFYSYIFHRRNDYDAVFVHMNPVYVILGAPLWKLWNKTIALWYTHKRVDMKLRIAESLADVVFTASQTSFRLESEKVRVMGHGIDTKLFSPGNDNEEHNGLQIVTVGRISPVKDCKTLLRAARKLDEGTDIDFQITIVGGPVTDDDAEYFQELIDYVDTHQLASHVTFVGSVSNEDVVEYYRDADVFVNMSNTGSLDKVVLEAMACNVFPLTSNEALKDVFKEKSDRHMFSVGDSNALKEMLRKRATTPKDSDTLASLRKEVVENHSIDSLISQIVTDIQNHEG